MDIYLAKISGIKQEIYESARIDGALRLQSIILLFILAVGRIFIGNFAMIYAMVGSNSLLFSTTEVIDTYVYRGKGRFMKKESGKYTLFTIRIPM